jgi:hypothetical protein
MRISEIKSYGKGFTHKEKQRIGYDPDLLAYRHKVKDIYPMEAVNWQALRTAGVVMPMAYYVPSNPVKPNVKEPNIITAYNLEKEKLGPGERLTPFTDQQVTPQFWQQFMNRMWPRLKPFKKDQIRQSAKMKGIEFNEWMIMPQTIEPMGLIQKKGYFDFKNKGNNRVNEAVQFTKPDTQYEWSEAQRYSYIKKLGFVGWNKLVNTGRKVNVSQFGGIRKINNTTALNQPMAARELPKLEPDKVQRAQQSLKMGKFELPIVMKTPQGTLELVAGNTRFTMMVAKGMTPTVWYIDGSALREWTAFEMSCMEGGHPLPEDTVNEKCWDGYKQVGMKNKGGRQVPNCVPEDAAGVGIITKQNTTKDVKPGDEYKNVKKLQLAWREFKENFADKKVKGKSRPGRVKRSGASCKGSVTSLRSKAKRYGGERGKMYHWCANMKSGKK